MSGRPLRLVLAWCVVSGAAGAGVPVAAGEPSLEDLVRWNAGEIFPGARFSLNDKGRFTLEFPGAGEFEKAFRCRTRGGGQGIVSESGRVKDVAVRKTLIDGAEGKFSFVALAGGTAISNFAVGTEFKVSFKVRIPTMMKTSRIVWYLPRDGKDYVQLDFFNEATLVAKGRRRSRSAARAAAFRGSPSTWFDRKSKGVPVEFVRKDGTLSVRLPTPPGRGGDEEKGLTEVVTLDGIERPEEGQLALSFDRISFLVSDLRIEGQLPRAWVEKKIDELRESGALRSEAPQQPGSDPPAKRGEDGESEKERSDSKEAGTKGKGPDLDKPDPEADVDL